MRIPQPPERIKEVPAQALRAVFAGVGQVLLLTERVRRRTVGYVHSSPVSAGRPGSSDAPSGYGGPETTGTERVQASSVAAAPAPAEAKARVAKAATATVGTAKKETAAAATAEAAAVVPAQRRARVPGTKPAPAASKAPAADTAPAASTPAGGSAPASGTAPAAGEPAVSEAVPSPAAGSPTAELPLPNYQELTFASIRARMRSLDAEQIRGLLEYERTHADRANVITMFERRIAKLEGTEDADTATP